MSRPVRCQKGMTLVEMIISMALLALVNAAFMGALSGGLRSGSLVEDRTTAANMTTAQLENTLSQTYAEPPDYSVVTPPAGYTLSTDSSVLNPTLLEQITAAISSAGNTILQVTTHKVNSNYIASPPTALLSQRDFRWYANADSLTPVTALATENSGYTITALNQVYRLRMSVQVNQLPLSAGAQTFKLQYATSTGGPWTDVGAVGSGEIWRGYNNVTPADGATLPSVLLSTSNVAGSYEEANPTALNPNAINIGQLGEWDWVVQDNMAGWNVTYYFRMVWGTGAAFDSYVNYPQITTATITFTQQDYRWYDNVNGTTPTTPLASENTAYGGATTPIVYRIRMNVAVGGINLPGSAQAFKLQYATSTLGPWTDVGAIGSGQIWRGYDNTAPSTADGNTLPSVLLTTSNVAGSYEEANPTVRNPNAVNIGQRGEWDWVVQDNNAALATTYYFRMTRSDGTVLDTYTNYPAITTVLPVIASDDFESGGFSGGTGWLASWNPVGAVGIVSYGNPHQGTFDMELAQISSVSRKVNLFGKTSATLQFWARAKSFHPGSTANVSISPDGTSWTVVQSWINGDDDNSYHYFSINLSSYPMTSTFWISISSNFTSASDSIYFDVVEIIGQ